MDRDDTPIPFTINDRLLAESTANEVAGTREDIKELAAKFDKYLEAHARLHQSLDGKINAVQTTQKITSRIFKTTVIIISGISALTGIAKAFDLF